MTLTEILLLIIAIALSIIVVRINLKFDINKFLENHRKIKLDQLKNICPHGTMRFEDKNIIFEPFFASPRGTTRYVCSQCGLIIDSEDEVNRVTEPLLKDINYFIKRQRKFIKQAKKLKIY